MDDSISRCVHVSSLICDTSHCFPRVIALEPGWNIESGRLDASRRKERSEDSKHTHNACTRVCANMGKRRTCCLCRFGFGKILLILGGTVLGEPVVFVSSDSAVKHRCRFICTG